MNQILNILINSQNIISMKHYTNNKPLILRNFNLQTNKWSQLKGNWIIFQQFGWNGKLIETIYYWFIVDGKFIHGSYQRHYLEPRNCVEI